MAFITHSTLRNSQPTSHFSQAFARLGATLGRWRKRIEEREQLARLDERSLRDIGLSRSAIEAELRKPFWRE